VMTGVAFLPLVGAGLALLYREPME